MTHFNSNVNDTSGTGDAGISAYRRLVPLLRQWDGCCGCEHGLDGTSEFQAVLVFICIVKR